MVVLGYIDVAESHIGLAANTPSFCHNRMSQSASDYAERGENITRIGPITQKRTAS